MKHLIKDIVEEIQKSADDLLQKTELDLVERGELIAYAESLCIIQDVLSGYDLSEYGLDFDVDEKYLC